MKAASKQPISTHVIQPHLKTKCGMHDISTATNEACWYEASGHVSALRRVTNEYKRVRDCLASTSSALQDKLKLLGVATRKRQSCLLVHMDLSCKTSLQLHTWRVDVSAPIVNAIGAANNSRGTTSRNRDRSTTSAARAAWRTGCGSV